MLKLKRVKWGKAGLSFIELIFATVILTVAMIPIISLLRNLSAGAEKREIELRALQSAQNFMETLRNKKWDENSPNLAQYTATRSSTLGADTGETSTSNFDDIDDYTGTSDNSDPLFTSSVLVSYVAVDPGTGDTTSSVLPTDFKEVTVTLVLAGNPPRSRTVSSVVPNGAGR